MVLGVLLLMLSMPVFKSFTYICPSLFPLAPLVPHHFVSQGHSLGPGACRVVGLADWPVTSRGYVACACPEIGLLVHTVMLDSVCGW